MKDLDIEEKWVPRARGPKEEFVDWLDAAGDVRKSLDTIIGYTGYYKMGKYHRLSGPARIWSKEDPWRPNQKLWFFEGNLIKVKSQQDFERYLKMKAFW